MKTRSTVAITACLLCTISATAADAACWSATNFAGQSARKHDVYRMGPDKLTSSDGRPLVIILKASPSGADVTGWSAGSCTATTQTEVQCRGGETFDLWKVDEDAKKAVLVRYRRGLGPFDGATILVGDLIGRCD